MTQDQLDKMNFTIQEELEVWTDEILGLAQQHECAVCRTETTPTEDTSNVG